MSHLNAWFLIASVAGSGANGLAAAEEAAKPTVAPSSSPLAVSFAALRAQEEAMKKALLVARGETPRLEAASTAAVEFRRLVEQVPALAKDLSDERRKTVQKETNQLKGLAGAVDKFARRSDGTEEATRFFRQLQLHLKGLQAQFPTEPNH